MKKYFIALISVFFLISAFAQKKKITSEELKPSDLSGLEFRSVGPAFMSGRIADIAINPENENEWYVAVGSGGVWKTVNSGTTWKPIADNESFYSTGCITIDLTTHLKFGLELVKMLVEDMWESDMVFTSVKMVERAGNQWDLNHPNIFRK